jgi:hypothetical protein
MKRVMHNADGIEEEKLATSEGTGLVGALRDGLAPDRQSRRRQGLANHESTMKTLSVQILRDRLSEGELTAALHVLKSMAETPLAVEEVKGTDPPYLTVNFEASDARRLWDRLAARMADHSDPLWCVAKASIVVCEGDEGWDDYLLLHHFDPQQSVDTFAHGDYGQGSN